MGLTAGYEMHLVT